MAILKPDRHELPAGVIPQNLIPRHVFHDAEVPILYVTKSVQDQSLLAYVCDIRDSDLFTLLVPFTEHTDQKLRSGAITVLEALLSAPAFLHWTNGTLSSAWAVDATEISALHLPDRTLMVDPALEPVLRTRAVGNELRLGSVPASAVAFVADATRKALKTILDYTLAVRKDGRPTDEHRATYDLPVQSLAFGSFELSFRRPEDEIFSRSEIQEAVQKLHTGLNWASSREVESLSNSVSDETEMIMRAVLQLTPPLSGPIKEMQVSGAWVPASEITLSRASRRKILKRLRASSVEQSIIYSGRLGSLDIDKLTFMLRDTKTGEKRGTFYEELTPIMNALLGRRVVLSGIEQGGRFSAHTAVDFKRATDILSRLPRNEDDVSDTVIGGSL